MALTTYSELKSAVADWLIRDDLTTQIADFIRLAEARINRELRVREMVEQATGTVSTQALDIPTGFIEVVKLQLDSESSTPLEYRPIEDAERRVASDTSGVPLWFSVLGGQFRFYPSPDGSYDYTLDYYSEVPALSDTATTNWLLTKAPDLYLFGALAEASLFLMEQDKYAVWRARFDEVKRSLHGAEARAKRTNGPLRMRVAS